MNRLLMAYAVAVTCVCGFQWGRANKYSELFDKYVVLDAECQALWKEYTERLLAKIKTLENDKESRP